MTSENDTIQTRYRQVNRLFLKALIPPQTLPEVLWELGLSEAQTAQLCGVYLSDLLQHLTDFLVNEVHGSREESRRHDMLVRHYGLDNCEKETLGHIGKDYHLSAERVRQLIFLRLQTMKQPAYQQRLREYLHKSAVALLQTDASENEL